VWGLTATILSTSGYTGIKAFLLGLCAACVAYELEEMRMHPRAAHDPPRRGRWVVLGLSILGAALTIAVAGNEVFRGASPPDRAAPSHGLDPFVAGVVRSVAGYGPSRSAFRCTLPSRCDGPKYVTFDSYVNNPVVGDERPFFAMSARPGRRVVDYLRVGSKAMELIMRVYVDNDTFQHLANLPTTDALDTRVRLALPSAPVYQAFPTIYLRAINAKPKTVWDTVSLDSTRPVRLTYVRGSTMLTRRMPGSPTIVSDVLGDGLASAQGLSLGKWKADFLYSGYLTFRVRVDPLLEPVRDPRATRGMGGQVVYAPPLTQGPATEPVRDSMVGDRFTCSPARCDGPPFAELNAYQNHPLLGDEADFVRAALASDYSDVAVETYHTVALVQPGDTLKVRIAIDNGGDPSAIGAPPLDQLVARDVRARVLLPAGAGRELRVVTFLDAANTQPMSISDTLTIRSDQVIRLSLLPKTVGVLTDSGLAPVSRALFATGQFPASGGHWGVHIGDLVPSFSKVVYVEFYLKVDAPRG
jgi:hypothetical protein